MEKRIAVAALTLALACGLAACSSDGSDGAKATDGGKEATTTAADGASGDDATTTAATGGDDGTTGGGDCGELSAGEGDVVNTFCDGPAVVTFTIGGVEHEIGGGTCAIGGGFFSVNAGVVSTAVDGSAPDYAGINMPEANGPWPRVPMAPSPPSPSTA